jgi:predicted ATPase
MVATYTDLGYQLVGIPRASVEARVRFILHHVGLASAS